MTSPQASIGYEHWEDFLYQLGAVCSASELQGALVGQLSAGQRLSPSQWLCFAAECMDLPLSSPSAIDEIPAEQATGVQALYTLVLRALQDDGYGFRPLLPDDALPLKTRIQALSQWCQGFLMGFGLAGPQALEALNGDLREAFNDISDISQMQLDAEESEENEVYLCELVEYVRLAALGIFEQLAPAAADAGSAVHAAYSSVH